MPAALAHPSASTRPGMVMLAALVAVVPPIQPICRATPRTDRDVIDRAEVVGRCERLIARYRDLEVAFDQELTDSDGGVSRCRVHIAPDRLLAEADRWVFCVGPDRAFSIGRSAFGSSLRGPVSPVTESPDCFRELNALRRAIGRDAGYLLPFPTSGVLTLIASQSLPITPHGVLRRADVTIQSVVPRPDGHVRFQFLSPARPVDAWGKAIGGQSLPVDGFMVCDSRRDWLIAEHQLNAPGHATRRTLTYQPLPGFDDLPVIATLEEREGGPGDERITRVVFSNFSRAPFPHHKADPAHYGLSADMPFGTVRLSPWLRWTLITFATLLVVATARRFVMAFKTPAGADGSAVGPRP